MLEQETTVEANCSAKGHAISEVLFDAFYNARKLYPFKVWTIKEACMQQQKSQKTEENSAFRSAVSLVFLLLVSLSFVLR